MKQPLTSHLVVQTLSVDFVENQFRAMDNSYRVDDPLTEGGADGVRTMGVSPMPSVAEPCDQLPVDGVVSRPHHGRPTHAERHWNSKVRGGSARPRWPWYGLMIH